jgi:hypothetical protein
MFVGEDKVMEATGARKPSKIQISCAAAVHQLATSRGAAKNFTFAFSSI